MDPPRGETRRVYGRKRARDTERKKSLQGDLIPNKEGQTSGEDSKADRETLKEKQPQAVSPDAVTLASTSHKKTSAVTEKEKENRPDEDAPILKHVKRRAQDSPGATKKAKTGEKGDLKLGQSKPATVTKEEGSSDSAPAKPSSKKIETASKELGKKNKATTSVGIQEQDAFSLEMVAKDLPFIEDMKRNSPASKKVIASSSAFEGSPKIKRGLSKAFKVKQAKLDSAMAKSVKAAVAKPAKAKQTLVKKDPSPLEEGEIKDTPSDNAGSSAVEAADVHVDVVDVEDEKENDGDKEKEDKEEENDEGKQKEKGDEQENGKEEKKERADEFKIVSWNVGGLRAFIKKGGFRVLLEMDADVVCMQEVRCGAGDIPPLMKEVQSKYGSEFSSFWAESNAKPGYAGCGAWSKRKPINVQLGIGDNDMDQEGRTITMEFEDFYVVNTYVPNAGRNLVTLEKRLRWNTLFGKYCADLDKLKPVIIAGDMNVAHNEIDLARPRANIKNAGFTKEERDGMTEFLALGFVDTFRRLYPGLEEQYTFWSYMGGARARNIGWRLDYFLVSERMAEKVKESAICAQVLGSDHCPIVLTL